MHQKQIKYIAFYDTLDNEKQNRNFAYAAKTKIDYIVKVLVNNGYEVEIISPSWTNNKSGFYRGDMKIIQPHVTLKRLSTFGAYTRFFRILKYLYSLIQIFMYLLINTKKDEQILIYHSIILSPIISLSKKIKKYKVILEIEEVYQDIQNLSPLMKKMEHKKIDLADKYILSNDLLNESLNKRSKPNIILYGTYEVKKADVQEKFSPGIHVVYAGTFDVLKGGAVTAIRSAQYLNSDYHMHILGFGKEHEINLVKEMIDKYAKITECTITYEGLLEGDEYIQFISKCHIGLSTQAPVGTYNDSSFPSKILSYMSNGLAVVSVKIKAVEVSKVAGNIFFYSTEDSEKIAEVIMSIDTSNVNSMNIIKEMNTEFASNLMKLLEVKYESDC